MFKEGDKYIHFTRFGSINKGTIKHIGYVGTIDTTNSVCYNRPYMVNEKNQQIPKVHKSCEIKCAPRSCCDIPKINPIKSADIKPIQRQRDCKCTPKKYNAIHA